MSDPEEAGKYHIENQQTVQGQVVGDYATVHIYNAPVQSSSTLPTASSEHVWNVPFARNPFVTGREDVLSQLHEHFMQAKTAALTQPVAITGLGGVGKTQIAIEYAYQHRQDYQAILWTSADTREALLSGYVEIAHLLQLPQKDEQDQMSTVKAVLRWLATQSGWLLILNNADELALVPEFLPPTREVTSS